METIARYRGSAAALIVAAGCVLHTPGTACAQSDGYHDASAVASAMSDIARARSVVRTGEIVRSPGGTPVSYLRLGAGSDVNERPALLIVAGAWGPHVVGSEIALRTTRSLAEAYGSDSTVTALLDRRTIYVIPATNPDAATGFFGAPQQERARNATPYDDDRDGLTDEDGPEDLNGDDLITTMRVTDPNGEWILDPDEPRLMRKANRAKGETGAYRLYTEGRDNDGDEKWNEDPTGGVDVNRNFPYAYEFFGEASGVHQVSAPEARAIAQFFIDHPNVAAVYALGPQDNLIEAWEHEPGPDDSSDEAGARGTDERQPRTAPTSVLEEDQAWFKEVAERFRDLTGLESGPESAAAAGDPLSFSYYDMGRWAFGSRGWWIPKEKEAEDDEPTADDEPAEGEEPVDDDKKDEEDPLEQERVALAWIDANRPDGFIDWTPIQHPDFEGRMVEIGGFRPHVRINPPAADLDSVAARHTRFIMALADMLPVVAIREVEVERVGDGVFRLTAHVANKGYLPSVSAMGLRARWPRRIKVELVTDGQVLSGGRAIQLLDSVEGSGGSVELSWLLVGPEGSQVTLRAGSPVAGNAEQTITLR
jgi:hypothetical protein